MQTPKRLLLAPALLVLAGILAGCSAATGGATAGPGTPGATTLPSLPFVDSPAAAAARVMTVSPLFDGIGLRDKNLIDQASWFEAAPLEAAKPPVTWGITFRVGWGDCPAGCISEHTWAYTIGVDEAVTFTGETGPALPPDVIEGLRAASHAAGVGGHVGAGPVCPVVQPGASNCDDRSVAGAVLVVTAGSTEITRVTTDASGLFRIGLTPGDYALTPQPVQGLMGTAAPMPFTVSQGALTYLNVSYDTGIR